MKSVGEAMAIGRTFKEARCKRAFGAWRSSRFGFGLDKYDKWLNAERASLGAGVQSVQTAQSSSPTASQTESRHHGQDARATGNLPASARTENDNSDKTTQGESLDHEWPIPAEKLRRKLAVPSQGRLYYIRYAMKMGWTIEQIHELTNIDPWFLGQMKELIDFEDDLASWTGYFILAVAGHQVFGKHEEAVQAIRRAKELGYSDVQLANIWQVDPKKLRQFRKGVGIQPVYKLVDTCAAEFEASTPYYYSTYETPFQQLTTDNQPLAKSEDEIRLTDKPKVLIIGGGPNRIGQGIEFDYCCVQAAFAMRELGLESVMINSNPETVSTDYDTSDLLFFEPLTHEDILNICERLNGGPFNSPSPQPSPVGSGGKSANLVKGVIVQFGGQTPLNLAKGLKAAGVPILGTTVESLDAAGIGSSFANCFSSSISGNPPTALPATPPRAREVGARDRLDILCWSARASFWAGGRWRSFRTRTSSITT